MCGRYASSSTDADLRREFFVDTVVGEPLAAWNVAPSQPIRAVVTRPPRPADTGHADVDAELEPAERQLGTVHWGLVPSWAKDRSIGNRLVNARVETVTEKPAFAAAAARRRCLIPADGYYEWEHRDGQIRKVPHFLRDPDGRELAFAGLYELWRDPERSPEDPDRWWWSAVIITTQASDALKRIHDRTPVLVPAGLRTDWLDPGLTDPGDVRHLLNTVPEPRLDSVEVSTADNNVHNDSPDLIQPVPAAA